MQVLFITWDGPGSTYLEGLFLPIFQALRPRGFQFHVLQFTWCGEEERTRLAQASAAAGISYRSASVWRRPVAPGSLATALLGRRHVRRAIRSIGIDILMPRSTLPALAAIPAAGEGGARLPLLLDADGLPHDERVEFNGASPTGPSYRLLRDIEAWAVRSADAVVVRTARAAGILAHRAGTGVGVERFHVVANARNENIFRPPSSKERGARRSALGLNEDQPLLVYTGSSLVGKYRGEAIFRFLREVRAIRSDARLLLLMPLHEEAHELMASNPDIAAACIVRSADPHEVAGWLGAADLGIALIHATFSMQAVAAIKLGEYLLCGLPVLASAGVGDTDTIIGSSVGRCLVEPDEQSLASAAHWFVNTVLPDRVGFEQRCRANGLANFSLDSAVRDYGDALRAALEARLGG